MRGLVEAAIVLGSLATVGRLIMDYLRWRDER